MWRGGGPQVAYGVPGIGSYEGELVFPRLQKQTPLRTVANWVVQFRPKWTPQHSMKTAPLREDDYVPPDLERDLGLESMLLDTPDSFDPGEGSLCQFFRLGTGAYAGKRDRYTKSKDNVASVDGLAFVLGARNNMLNVMALLPKVHRTTESREVLTNPKSAETYGLVEFGEPIRQIEVHPTLRIIAVRFLSSIHLVAYEWVNDPPKHVKMTRQGSVLAEGELGHITFADALWAVTVNGDIRRYSLLHQKVWKLVRGDNFATTDVFALSKWRRLIVKDQFLVVLSEAGLTLVDTETGAQKRLLLALFFSRILDMLLFEGYVFLLTTREVVWCKLDNLLERLLAWRHYLDTKDPTLRMSICKEKENFLIAVSSRKAPLVVFFTFKMGKRPEMPRDPFFLRTTFRVPPRSICIAPIRLSNNLNMAEVSPSGTAISAFGDCTFEKCQTIELRVPEKFEENPVEWEYDCKALYERLVSFESKDYFHKMEPPELGFALVGKAADASGYKAKSFDNAMKKFEKSSDYVFFGVSAKDYKKALGDSDVAVAIAATKRFKDKNLSRQIEKALSREVDDAPDDIKEVLSDWITEKPKKRGLREQVMLQAYSQLEVQLSQLESPVSSQEMTSSQRRKKKKRGGF